MVSKPLPSENIRTRLDRLNRTEKFTFPVDRKQDWQPYIHTRLIPSLMLKPMTTHAQSPELKCIPSLLPRHPHLHRMQIYIYLCSHQVSIPRTVDARMTFGASQSFYPDLHPTIAYVKLVLPSMLSVDLEQLCSVAINLQYFDL